MKTVTKNKHRKNSAIALWLMVFCASWLRPVQAQEEGVIVLSDTITGNQEQPKVLYIVPWQAADDQTMLKQSLVTKLQNDVFAHIERPEHRRQLQFIEQLTKSGTETE